MSTKTIPLRLVYFLMALVFVFSCTDAEPDNPFDNINTDPIDTVPDIILDPNTIEGLHKNMFKPTCANSGCHDGTFEPDYRSINSTYNTLVNHPVVKNDLDHTFKYRVVPGDVNKSILIARLTYDIDGFSGLMPLVVDPNSNWPANRDAYIQNIKNWINNGARDAAGNTPGTSTLLPKMEGVLVQVNGITLPRNDAGQGAARILQTVSQVDIYFAFSDDITAAAQFGVNQIRFQKNPNDFSAASPLSLEILAQPLQAPGYYLPNVSYTHHISINPKDYIALNETAFFRIMVKDSDNPATEMP
ncbi:MAG: hypothetical protein ABIV51_10560, partial [Saprospiraceae bacterium]